MPDSFVLYGPDGASPVQLASWVDLGKGGAAFGEDALYQPKVLETAAAAGGYLAYEQSNPRKFDFDLLVGSHSAWGGMDDAESMLRAAARPGGWIDLQPDGVPSTEAIRFDLIHGRWQGEYDTYLQRVSRRRGKLSLLVQPYGYWPTSILLASSASIGAIKSLSWSGAALTGDAPALLRVLVQPTVATAFALGVYACDYMGLSIAHSGSQMSFLHPASWTLEAGNGVLEGWPQAPASQVVRWSAWQNLGAWSEISSFLVASALEPAHRGRFRAFAYAQLSPSQKLPFQMSVDVSPALATYNALASAMPIATLPPAVASGAPGAYGVQGSNANIVLDLGELTLPAIASGLQAAQVIRLWIAPATSNIGIATANIRFGGLRLLRADGDWIAGVPRGITVPTIGAADIDHGAVDLDAYSERAVTRDLFGGLGSGAVRGDLTQHLRGRLPQGASGVRLDWIPGARNQASTATGPVFHMANAASISVSFTPRFAFLKGI